MEVYLIVWKHGNVYIKHKCIVYLGIYGFLYICKNVSNFSYIYAWSYVYMYIFIFIFMCVYMFYICVYI